MELRQAGLESPPLEQDCGARQPLTVSKEELEQRILKLLSSRTLS